MSLYKPGSFNIISELPSTNLAASFNSNAIEILSSTTFYVGLLFTGSSPTGTFQLQSNNDPTNVQSAVNSSMWVNVSTATAVTEAGYVSWNLPLQGYKWWRLTWTFTSGTGTVTAFNFTAKT